MVAASTHNFLTRVHDVTAVAMADGFHWRHMLSSVLPVEPEAAGVGAVVMAAAMTRNADRDLMEQLNLPFNAVVPLLVGKAIAMTS